MAATGSLGRAPALAVMVAQVWILSCVVADAGNETSPGKYMTLDCVRL